MQLIKRYDSTVQYILTNSLSIPEPPDNQFGFRSNSNLVTL